MARTKSSSPPQTPAAAASSSSSTLTEKLSDIGRSANGLSILQTLGGSAGIVTTVHSNASTGLTAAQVLVNRQAYGENQLPQKQRKPFWDHLVEALGDETLRILMFSALCSVLFGYFLSDSTQADVIQGGAILLAVVVVSGINSFQNWSKDREFHSLAAYTEKLDVRVLRDNEVSVVAANTLVVGDIVLLRSGDRIPAEGVLLGGYGVEVNMSSLNGEQEPSDRDETTNPIMSHSALVCGGSDIRMLVTAVGVNTEFGRLAKDVTEAEDKETPLQESLTGLADEIGKVGTAVGALTFAVLTILWLYNKSNGDVIGLLKSDFPALIRFFIVGVTIVVVAVPEGLPLAVTISLAFSMQRMLADKNLVRELQACETMGSATVIASDKTGTLTQNRMTVTRVYLPSVSSSESLSGDALDISTTPLGSAVGAATVARLASAIAVNSEANLTTSEDGVMKFDGSPTEGALLHMLQTSNVDYADVRQEARILRRRAFTKENKFQTTICVAENGLMSYVTGAPEVVLDMCSHVHGISDAKNHEIVDEMRLQLLAQQSALAKQGLRVLAVAFKRVDKASAGNNANTNWATRLGAPCSSEFESGLALWGLFGIQDPPRPGVPEAVKKIQLAGVRVMMVTGDAKDTAIEIARQCGILPRSSSRSYTAESVSSTYVMTGPEFRALDEEEKAEAAKTLAVIARCSPNDKLQLVRALQSNGEIVAVTGDGTNDAPALKAADVGLSMGIAGTEVAKEASKIVITDDNFASIVATVRWGRSIKQNIRKFLTFQLTINIVALTLTFITACLHEGSTEHFPIKPVQLLWINLIMDSFAALMLATEPPSERLMLIKPQGKDEELITRTMFKNMIGHAVFQTILLLWLTMTQSGSDFFGLDYIKADDAGDNILQFKEDTLVFTTFVFLQIFNLFNCRAVHDEWNILEGFTDSKITQFMLIVIVISQFFIVHVGGEIMQTTPLTVDEWKSCILLGSLSIPVGYLLKLVPVCTGDLRSMSDAEGLAMEVSNAAQGHHDVPSSNGSGGSVAGATVTAKKGAAKTRSSAAAAAAAASTTSSPPSSSSSSKKKPAAGTASKKKN